MVPHGNGLMKPAPFNPTKQVFDRVGMRMRFTKPKNEDFADITFA